MILEFDGPAGQPLATLPFRIDAISHQWGRITPLDSSPNTAAPCELDVSCYPSYLQYASGVTLYDFVADSGRDYLCSGAMINTNGDIPQPYMLTANHCIGSSSEAQSMQVYFNYQTASCNGPAPDLFSFGPNDGATYLAGAPIPGGDYTLVKLSSPPTAYYFGWSATDPAVGDAVVGIHHPASSWTRISFGERTADQAMDVSGVTAPANLFDQVVFTAGIIEEGSSGSPLLNAAGDIVGSLTAGPVLRNGELNCSISPFQAVYSRFSAAYAVLGGYLNVNPAPQFAVSPQSLQFTQSNGVASPLQQIAITTKSLSPVLYSVTTADGWLLPGPSGASGQVSAAAPAVLGLQLYNPPLTFTGTYRSSVTVTVGTGAPVIVPVTLSVTNTQSNVLVSMNASSQFLGVFSVTNASGGADWKFTINLTEVAGVGTALTAFKVGGVDYSSRIPALFGSPTVLPGASVNTLVSLSTSDPIPADPNRTQIELDGLDPTTNTAWSRVIEGITFYGVLASDPDSDLLMLAIPQVVRRNASSPGCPFRQHFVLQVLGNSPVTLTATSGLSLGTSLYTPVAGLLGSTYIPPGGTLQSDYCWPDNGGTLSNPWGNGIIAANDAAGLSRGLFFTPSLDPPAFVITSLTATPSTLNLTPKDTAPVAVSVDPRSASAPWDASVFYSQPPTSWLTVSPLAGAGPGQMRIAIKPTGLASGVYSANVIVESQNAVPQYVDIPITLTVPAAAGLAVVNSASFTWGTAPGGIASVFSPAMKLASGVAVAQAVPLPTNLLGTTVTVNGVTAPQYYVSPTLVNAQIPYETPPGNATLTVKNSSGQTASQQIYINAVAPGVFLAADGRHIAASVPTKPGDYATLYLTGQGYVSPAVATGAAPPPPSQIPVTQLPQPLANVSVLVNGVEARISFAGIPYYLAGVTQVNYIVPPGTPAGDQPVVVVLAGVSSNTAYLTVTP